MCLYVCHVSFRNLYHTAHDPTHPSLQSHLNRPTDEPAIGVHNAPQGAPRILKESPSMFLGEHPHGHLWGSLTRLLRRSPKSSQKGSQGISQGTPKRLSKGAFKRLRNDSPRHSAINLLACTFARQLACTFAFSFLERSQIWRAEMHAKWHA